MFTLGSTLIFVTDVVRAKEWYEKMLGMNTVEFRPPEFLEMTLGDAIFNIETFNEKRAAGFKEARVGGRHTTVFTVANIKESVESLRKKGCAIIVEPVQQFWGGWNAVIADPDGNEFVLDQDSL